MFQGAAWFGRADDNDIVLNEPEDRLVSRRHARIEEINGSFMLLDESTNGTFINGLRLEAPVKLGHGDSFEIADYRFTFLENQAVKQIDHRRDGRPRAFEESLREDEETLVVERDELDDPAELKANLLQDDIIVESEKMIALYRDVMAVAGINVPVLIRGEPGTGKERVARTLHRLSGSPGEFVPLNCSAIPEALFESELFGSVKGAFHNAQDKPGKLELAHNGTILLDEIGDMNLSIQPKLLRFLEDKLLTRLGDNRTRNVDVRVLSASNQDLEAMITNGSFRSDLYHRLACIRLEIPPLRERKEEIPRLTTFFLQKFADEHQWDPPPVSNDAMNALLSWDWPGNVRELMNVLLNASIQARGKPLSLEHLTSIKEESGARPSAPSGSFPAMKDVEKRHILDALEATGGNKRKAARILGVSRDTLYRRMKEFGIPI